MDKAGPPAYGFVVSQAPPSYEQAMGQAPIPPATDSPMPTEQPRSVPIVTRVITRVVTLGPHSTHMTCPSCSANVNTKVRSTPGVVAWLSGFLIALFGCWLGCCLIPCCIDECMDSHHYCPNCNAYLGRYGSCNTV